MQRNGKYNRAYGTMQKKNFKIEDDMQIVMFGKYAERNTYTYAW